MFPEILKKYRIGPDKIGDVPLDRFADDMK